MPLQNLRFALRQPFRHPGVTLTAVIILGIGIGAATTLFSVVDAVLFEPLPYPEPDRIVRVRELTPDGDSMSFSAPNYLDFRQRSRSFAELGAIGFPGSSALTAGGEPERVRALAVTSSFFRVFGAEPAEGRNFLAQEEVPGQPPRAVILSHGLWVRRFAADPQLVGRSLEIDGEDVRVVGILPEGFRFVFDAEIFLPLAPDPEHPRGDHRLEVFGRLADGVSLEEARAELGAIAGALATTYPESNEGYGVLIDRLRDDHIGRRVRQASLVLFAAVGLLLLLACANVSNLLLAQATGRKVEIALRSALGAGGRKIVVQLLIESVVLALLGSAAGVLLAFWSVSAIASLDALPPLVTVAVDLRVLLFAAGVALATGVVFGLAPALMAARSDLHVVLRGGGHESPRRERRLRDALVIGELALATTLLVGAGLLGHTFLRLLDVDPGFKPDGVWAFDVSPPSERYPEFQPPTAALYRDLVDRLDSIPGVRSAGAIMVRPWSGFRPRNQVVAERGARGQDDPLPIQWRVMTPGAFETLEIPLLRGRLFGPEDRIDPEALAAAGGQAPVLPAVVTRTLAERLWPQAEAVGERMRWGDAEGSALVVVGVVGDVQDIEIGMPPPPMVFLPHPAVPWPDMTVVIRAEAEPAALSAAVRRAVREIEPGLAVPVLEPLAESRREALSAPRFYLLTMSCFAAVALLLAATGIYGVLSFVVAQRTREIGIRLALGARPRDMVRLVLRFGGRLAILGLGLGILGAMAASRLLEGLLFDTPALDPGIYAGVAALLMAVALVASYLPGQRAGRVDPRDAITVE